MTKSPRDILKKTWKSNNRCGYMILKTVEQTNDHFEDCWTDQWWFWRLLNRPMMILKTVEQTNDAFSKLMYILCTVNVNMALLMVAERIKRMNGIDINVREYRRCNKKWTIQRNWQHMVNKTKKTKAKTQCVGHHGTQGNTNNVNKTWSLLQITGGKDEPNKHKQRK